MDREGDSMYAKGQTIIQLIEELAPKSLALPDDKIGLQVGSLNKEIKKVMVTLDILENVVDEAIAKEVDLIISHHAVIYKPLKNLRTDLPQGKIYEKLIKADISVYVAHTNLDMADGGVNDVLSQQLELEDITLLEEHTNQKLKKFVVFVPKDHQQVIIDAISSAGAGWIGNYSHCTFNIEGTGTFMPREGTTPFIGKQNQLEQVEEVRIETIIPEEKQNQIIKAMLHVHPYEEVAYDIYPVEIKGKSYGIGRIGKLKQPMKFYDFANFVKGKLGVKAVRAIGNLDQEIKKVAVVGGDGNSFVSKASFRGADVLVTGDIYYHTAHEALANGLTIIDAGHNIEKNILPILNSFLQTELKNRKYSTEVIISETDTNPFQFI